MAITVHNAEIGTGTAADPTVYTLVFTPTAGRSLLVATQQFDNITTGISDSGSNTWVEDFTFTSNVGAFYRVEAIGTVPTTISVDLDGTSGFGFFAVLEVSGLATSPVGSTLEETNTGAGTAHSQSYTTTVADSLVFGWFTDSNDDWQGASGTTILVQDTSEARGGLYKTVATAETGTLNFTSAASRDPNMIAHVVYDAEAAAGGGAAKLIGGSLIK